MKSLIVPLVLLSCFGCEVRHYGRLTGPAPIGDAPIVLEVDAHRHGRAEAELGSGEHCRGRFNTVADEVDLAGDDAMSEDVELTQVGMLVLVCPTGPVIRCNFSRELYGSGAGQCIDGGGRNYALKLL